MTMIVSEVFSCITFDYLYRDTAKRSSNDSRDGEWAVLLQGIRSIWTDELGVIHLGKRRSYKLQSLEKHTNIFNKCNMQFQLTPQVNLKDVVSKKMYHINKTIFSPLYFIMQSGCPFERTINGFHCTLGAPKAFRRKSKLQINSSEIKEDYNILML